MKKVIICGGFYDAKAEQVLKDKVVVVSDNKIEEVMDKAAYKAIPDAQVYDLSDRYVLPGMIDCHTHVAFYPMNEAKMPHPMAFGLRTNELTTEANAAVREVCGEFSFVEYLDCNEGLKDAAGKLKEEFAIDGVHLWPEAYALVLETLKPCLEA